ncbi:MerR family transcriptional regulator [Streptomyces aculeolatus]|jgi:predicted site-specific integrase-resolvase
MTRPPRHRLVPTNVAALAVGVSEATIRKWASRGKITRYGAPNCRQEFDIDELTRIALERRACAPAAP